MPAVRQPGGERIAGMNAVPIELKTWVRICISWIWQLNLGNRKILYIIRKGNWFPFGVAFDR